MVSYKISSKDNDEPKNSRKNLEKLCPTSSPAEEVSHQPRPIHKGTKIDLKF